MRGPLKLFKSELNWEKAVLMFLMCMFAASLVFAETTKRIAVWKPAREDFSSILSSTFGSVLNVAFSGLASVFFVEETYDFPIFFHFVSAGRIKIWIMAPSSSPILEREEVIVA